MTTEEKLATFFASCVIEALEQERVPTERVYKVLASEEGDKEVLIVALFKDGTYKAHRLDWDKEVCAKEVVEHFNRICPDFVSGQRRLTTDEVTTLVEELNAE